MKKLVCVFYSFLLIDNTMSVWGGKGKDKPFPPEGLCYSIRPKAVSTLLCRSVSIMCKCLKTAILYIVLGTISNDYLDQSVGRLVYLCDLSRRFASRGLPKHNYLELESI